MKKYQNILFDMDGTLIDSQNGIMESIIHTLKILEINEADMDKLRSFIGPPLKKAFVDAYNMSENDADNAVEIFREYYKEKGIYNVELYTGIESMLNTLKESGYHLFIATSKPTDFTEKIVSYLNIDQYFRGIAGSNLDNTRSKKSEVIQYLLDTYQMDNKDEILMIGDKSQDIRGACQCGISAVAVSYGYGTENELLQSKPLYIADSPEDLTLYIRKTEYE
ncbi:MAG TPA: HAD-IA family hydrolase [Candidatus Mediterraneibacter excrementigallinarum]|nr:HAD-IA family hydrolase [Candidatus Mediterraneibacter excrementigallinarum]